MAEIRRTLAPVFPDQEKGTDSEDSHKSTPMPAPLDVPLLARRAQVSPKFFESLSRVPCISHKDRNALAPATFSQSPRTRHAALRWWNGKRACRRNRRSEYSPLTCKTFPRKFQSLAPADSGASRKRDTKKGQIYF